MVSFQNDRSEPAGFGAEAPPTSSDVQTETTDLSPLSMPETARQPEEVQSLATPEDIFANDFVPHPSVADLTDWEQVHEFVVSRSTERTTDSPESLRPEVLQRLTNWDKLEQMIRESRLTERAEQSRSEYGQSPNEFLRHVPPDLLSSQPLLDPAQLALSNAELLAAYETYRADVGPFVAGFREQLSTLGLSGRGEKDLDITFKEKNGTYNYGGIPGGGSIMIWSLENMSTASPDVILNNLEEIGIRAINYATLTNAERLKTDPNPGGIMILATERPPRVHNAPMSALGRDESNRMGETTIPLHKGNFDSLVRGVIPFESFRPIVEQREQLAEALERHGFGKPEASPELYNPAFERLEVLNKFSALLVAIRSLSLLEGSRQ